jgi:hypothetical protein
VPDEISFLDLAGTSDLIHEIFVLFEPLFVCAYSSSHNNVQTLLFQFVSQRQKQIRGSALKLLMNYLRTFLCCTGAGTGYGISQKTKVRVR